MVSAPDCLLKRAPTVCCTCMPPWSPSLNHRRYQAQCLAANLWLPFRTPRPLHLNVVCDLSINWKTLVQELFRVKNLVTAGKLNAATGHVHLQGMCKVSSRFRKKAAHREQACLGGAWRSWLPVHVQGEECPTLSAKIHSDRAGSASWGIGFSRAELKAMCAYLLD